MAMLAGVRTRGCRTCEWPAARAAGLAAWMQAREVVLRRGGDGFGLLDARLKIGPRHIVVARSALAPCSWPVSVFLRAER
jgi:hypothetical protein